MTVLVTDVHYRMSLALIRDLADAGARVVVCEREALSSDALGFHSARVDRAVSLPDDGYTDGIFELCREIYDLDLEKPTLFCVGAKTLAAVSEDSERFAEVANFLIPSKEQLDLFNDKFAVSALAKRLSVKVPVSFEREDGESVDAFASRVSLPAVVKPICGEKFGLSAKQRYIIARSPKELVDAYLHFEGITNEAPVVQEYISGRGVGCSVLARDGEILASICHERVREYPVSGGPSSCSRVIFDDSLLRDVSVMVKETSYSGVAMFEFKRSPDGAHCLLEVNPRIWGTFPLTRASGSDFSRLWLFAARGETLAEYKTPKACKMVFYPSDLAATAGYLRHGKIAAFFGGLIDFIDPRVKNGIADKNDKKPLHIYYRSLLKRR